MIFYTDLTVTVPDEGYHNLNLSIDAPTFSVAVREAEAWRAGYSAATGLDVSIDSIAAGAKPRGKTYFRLHEWDTIRAALAIAETKTDRRQSIIDKMKGE